MYCIFKVKSRTLKYLDLYTPLGGFFLHPLKHRSGHIGWSLQFQLEDRAAQLQDFLTAKNVKYTLEDFSKFTFQPKFSIAATQCHSCKNINRELSYWQFLPSDFSGWGLSWRGVQVTLRDQVLQQVDQGSTGVSTSVKVDHIVGATKLKERLQLAQRMRLSNVCSHTNALLSSLLLITLVLHN